VRQARAVAAPMILLDRVPGRADAETGNSTICEMPFASTGLMAQASRETFV